MPQATIAELFEAQAARDPDAVAMVFGERRLSYGQLNACANRLAHHLIASGVEPDSLVGIGMDRSLEMVAALLGILKAGAAYAPIDPDLPAARRERLVTDSGLRHIVTSRRHAALYEGCVAQVVTLEACGHQPDSNPASVALPLDRLAYLNFTSGSTGEPKGVMVPHAGVVRLVHQPRFVALGRASRVLQMAPLNFDAATFEIWGALLNGGSLVVMPPGPLSVEESAASWCGSGSTRCG